MSAVGDRRNRCAPCGRGSRLEIDDDGGPTASSTRAAVVAFSNLGRSIRSSGRPLRSPDQWRECYRAIDGPGGCPMEELFLASWYQAQRAWCQTCPQ